MKKKKRKNRDAKKAEWAGEHWAVRRMGAVRSQRAVRTQFQKVDYFGCDVVAKQSDGTHIYIQVTAGNSANVAHRRRKLEKQVWHETDRVFILNFLRRGKQGNRVLYAFIVHEYECLGFGEREWYRWPVAQSVPVEFLTPVKKEKGDGNSHEEEGDKIQAEAGKDQGH